MTTRPDCAGFSLSRAFQRGIVPGWQRRPMAPDMHRRLEQGGIGQMCAEDNDCLRKLYIEPSSKCNLSCTMCFRNGWINEKKDLMQEATFQNLLASIRRAPPKVVVLGGMGEPLLAPEIGNWIADLHEIGCRTELITNGILLDETQSERLLSAGLDRVWISMEGFCRGAYERIRKGGMFNVLIENINGYNRNRAALHKGELGVTFVMVLENMRELNRFNAFADLNSVDEINVSHAIPMSPVSRDEVIYWDGYPTGPMKRWHMGFQKRAANFCRFVSEGNCFVRWDGEVAPCMQMLHESYTYLYREKRHVHRIGFGNVNQCDLHEIWHCGSYAAFRKKVMEFDFPSCTLCDGCDDRLSNEADCDFNTFPTCGACLWAQGIVSCP